MALAKLFVASERTLPRARCACQLSRTRSLHSAGWDRSLFKREYARLLSWPLRYPMLRMMSSAADSGASVAMLQETAADEEPLPAMSNAEIKDATIIFDTVWRNLIEKHGEPNLRFPKEIMWLAGAPGSGKGAVTEFIQEMRDFSAPPIQISQLLVSPDTQSIKNRGHLVSDRQVIELLFEALLKPENANGVIVDGFPRTPTQAECINRLFDRMRELRRKYDGTELFHRFRRPVFHITVLFVEESVSVLRQLERGKKALAHNRAVHMTGYGSLLPVRNTDLDEDLARERYRQFKDQVYESLQGIKEKFHFHFLNAAGSMEEVKERVIKELEYQSSMELNNETFELVRRIPLASEVIQNARQEMVKRLDDYRSHHQDLFARVIGLLEHEFVAIIRRQALAGKAIIRSESPVFNEPLAVDMALDVLAERGFVAVLDKQRRLHVTRVDMSSGTVVEQRRTVYEFQIEFPRPTIRRG